MKPKPNALILAKKTNLKRHASWKMEAKELGPPRCWRFDRFWTFIQKRLHLPKTFCLDTFQRKKHDFFSQNPSAWLQVDGSTTNNFMIPQSFLVIPTHPSSQQLLHHTTNPSKAVENRHLMTKGSDGSGAFDGIRKMTHARRARSA